MITLILSVLAAFVLSYYALIAYELDTRTARIVGTVFAVIVLIVSLLGYRL